MQDQLSTFKLSLLFQLIRLSRRLSKWRQILPALQLCDHFYHWSFSLIQANICNLGFLTTLERSRRGGRYSSWTQTAVICKNAFANVFCASLTTPVTITGGESQWPLMSFKAWRLQRPEVLARFSAAKSKLGFQATRFQFPKISFWMNIPPHTHTQKIALWTTHKNYPWEASGFPLVFVYLQLWISLANDPWRVTCLCKLHSVAGWLWNNTTVLLSKHY